MKLLLMIFLHIVDDYYLQSILAQLKQKKFWKENAPDALYKYDYIWALIMHAFSWAFMIMLPIALTRPVGVGFYIAFAVNLIVHAVVDDLKANRYKLNLWGDQLIHILQIITTFIIFN